VQRETPVGIVFEFWVDAVDGSGPARASDQLGRGFREGDLVEVEGARDPNGVLDAKTMVRIVASESRLPAWLRPPMRWLLPLVPLAAFLTMAVMYQIGGTRRADRSVLAIVWVVLGAALYSYARKHISGQRLVLARTVSGH